MIFNKIHNSARKLIDENPSAAQNKFLRAIGPTRTYGTNYNGYGYTDTVRVYELTRGQVRKYNCIEKERRTRARKNVENIRQLLAKPEKIAEAIYSLNKEAKRQRDIQNKAADAIWGDEITEYDTQMKSLKHHRLHRAKNNKAWLYSIKNDALQKLIAEHDLKPVGYHEFPDVDRLLYEFRGFTFHIEGEIEGIENLGDIDEWIDSNRKRSMPPRKAKLLLRFYLTDKKTSAA